MHDSLSKKHLLQSLRNGEIKPGRYGELWSDEEREQLCSLFDSGEELSLITLQLQRSESSVVQQLIILGKFDEGRPSRTRRKPIVACKCGQCDLPEDELPEHCPKRSTL